MTSVRRPSRSTSAARRTPGVAIAAYSTYVFSGLESTGVYPIPPVPNPLVIVEWIGKLFGQDWQIWQIISPS